MEQKFTGNEKFTMTFTSEEWILMCMGVQYLVEQMELAADVNLERLLPKYQEVLEKGNEITKKIGDIMGISFDEEN